jgi:hypothetical protein
MRVLREQKDRVRSRGSEVLSKLFEPEQMLSKRKENRKRLSRVDLADDKGVILANNHNYREFFDRPLRSLDTPGLNLALCNRKVEQERLMRRIGAAPVPRFAESTSENSIQETGFGRLSRARLDVTRKSS